MNLPRSTLPLLLAAYVSLAFAYSIINPLGEAADEVPHFAYVRYIVANQQLPSSEGTVFGEARQPPLYYFVGALATFWIPGESIQAIANPDYVPGDPQTPNALLHTTREAFPYQGDALAWHLVRLLSLIMGAVTVWATWRISLVLCPKNPWLAFGSAAFVAFLPSFVFLSASVNNDNLVIMLVALSVLQVVSVARATLRWSQSILLGILMGLSVLAKWSGIIVWPFAGVVILFSAFQSRNWKQVTLHLFLSFGVASLIIAPWAFDNLIKYGDPLGWSMALSTTELRLSPMTLNDWLAFCLSLSTSFWGRFGGDLQLEMPGIVYAILGAVGIVALLGWIEYARDGYRRRIDSNTRALFAVFCLFWLILLGFYVRWTLTFAGTNQARLIHPGLPLLAIVAIAGLARFFSTRSHSAIVVSTSGLLMLNLFVLMFLLTTYDPASTIANLRPLGGKSAPADFGGMIRITDYKVDQSRVAPGGSITVQVYWQALEDIHADYWLLLQLTDQKDAAANKDGVPSGGRVTTDWWQMGQAFESHHTLMVPDDLPPGTYTLRIGLHPFGTWNWLPVNRRDMLDLANIQIE